MPSIDQPSILLVSAPGTVGGVESVLLELAGGLVASGCRVALVPVLDPAARDHPVPRQAAELGVEVVSLVVPPRAYLYEYRRILRTIEWFRPDVVHTHGYRADLIAGFAARRAGVPWVATAHGFTGGGPKNHLFEWLQVRSYRKAQATLAVSRPIRDRLAAEGVPAGRIQLLPNAYTIKPLSSPNEARRLLGLSRADPVVGWVGRLSREKGADIFLETLALLADLPWQASVIGDGPERGKLEDRARVLGIADRVRWHGEVPNAGALYQAFDAWVLSSRTEGTPIALFEAMAARVPVVVTAVGGVPDVVSPGEAVIVPAEDPEALAEGLRRVFTEPEAAAARTESAHQRLRKQFAPGDWMEAHISIYDDLRQARAAED